jgi:hypothetical protein
VQLEKEQLAWLKCSKRASAARLPEIHLIRRYGRQVTEPVIVGNSNPELHDSYPFRLMNLLSQDYDVPVRLEPANITVS